MKRRRRALLAAQTMGSTPGGHVFVPVASVGGVQIGGVVHPGDVAATIGVGDAPGSPDGGDPFSVGTAPDFTDAMTQVGRRLVGHGATEAIGPILAGDPAGGLRGFIRGATGVETGEDRRSTDKDPAIAAREEERRRQDQEKAESRAGDDYVALAEAMQKQREAEKQRQQATEQAKQQAANEEKRRREEEERKKRDAAGYIAPHMDPRSGPGRPTLAQFGGPTRPGMPAPGQARSGPGRPTLAQFGGPTRPGMPAPGQARSGPGRPTLAQFGGTRPGTPRTAPGQQPSAGRPGRPTMDEFGDGRVSNPRQNAVTAILMATGLSAALGMAIIMAREY